MRPRSLDSDVSEGPMADSQHFRGVYVRYWGSFFKHAAQLRQVVAEFRVLVDRGWQCHLVLSQEPQASWRDALIDMGVQLVYMPRPRTRFDWRAVFRIRRLCRRASAAVVRCDNIHVTPLLGASLARVPVRVWFKRAMNSCYEECRKPTFRERIGISTRLSCWLATRVIAVSDPVRDELVSMGICEDKVKVRHNPKRSDLLERAAPRSLSREKLGLGDSDVAVVAIGHAVPVKGWDVLLHAFADLACRVDNARLLLVGSYDASHEAAFYCKLKRFVDEYNLGKMVRFTGRIEGIQDVLSAADIFVQASRSEGFSNVLIEAIDAGLPCVTTRVGVAEQVVRPGENGLLVERCDAAALTAAIRQLVEDESLRRRFSQHAVVPCCIPSVTQYADQMAMDYEALLPSAVNRDHGRHG